MKNEPKTHGKKPVSEFYKRFKKQMVNMHTENRALSIATGATGVFLLLFLANAYDFFTKTFSTFFVAMTAVYVAELLYMYFVMKKVQKEIVSGGIKKGTRLLGIPMLLFLVSGNFMAFAAGGILLKEDPTIEYQLCVYMIMTNLAAALVSCLNLFKQYVAGTFFLGMGLLAALTVFYIVATVFVWRGVTQKDIDKKLIWLTIPLALSVISGNLFALALALIIFRRCRQENKDVSIKWVDIVRRLFKNQMAVAGAFIVVFLIAMSVWSSLTFEDYFIFDNDYSALLLKPSLQYPFGTDEFGRCVFSRIIYGARISLLIGLASIIYPIFIGGTLGALAGYYGGKLDDAIMRVMDVIYAIPGVLLSMVIIASFGATVPNLIIALGVGRIASYARVTRATVLNMANAEFVEAAKACGANDAVIIFKHIVLNSLSPIIVNATIGIGGVVLSTSSLSYLGIGIPSHIPEWGNVLRAGSTYLETQPYLAIFPGIAIIVLVLAFNFFGDGVRDALDPKLK